MKIDGTAYRSIWLADDGRSVEIIDQTLLPHALEVRRLGDVEDAVEAIAAMRVRGAPLIGATGAYGLCLALQDDAGTAAMEAAAERLVGARPTAVNLRWAVESLAQALKPLGEAERIAFAYEWAARLCDEDVAQNAAIGQHGKRLIEIAHDRKAEAEAPVNVLTHCNAGWLATVDFGTALSPIYQAHDAGIPVHVWVDETRPRNQGAAITAWELAKHGVPHTVIVDNAGGHLMRRGLVDLCITGTDRVTANGDVCNKIGTYLKALAANDSGVPFYVALPGPTIDWSLPDGEAVPIEERDPREVTHVTGRSDDGTVTSVRVTPEESAAANYAFDVTPAHLVSAFITERGMCPASREGLLSLYPERREEAAE